MKNDYEHRLWKLLEKEKLTDLSQFHQRGSFDEVPLFSRESDIKFLSKERDKGNDVLIQFALKFLTAVVAYEEHPSGYFAAITLWSSSAGQLVPNLFVWCGNVRGLKERLSLETGMTPFSKQVSKLVSRLQWGEKFEICEDTSTDPDATRVFIALRRPPYEGFAPLATFRHQAKTVR